MQLKNHKLTQNPFLIFLPFLILYVVLILIFAKAINQGDENRYLNYAFHLTRGFYSYPPPRLDLGNGPGYPLIITPFVALKMPLIYIKLLNAVFYYLSVVLLFKALQQIVPFKFAIIFSLVWALYPNTFDGMPYALSEVFACSLIPLLLLCLILAFKEDERKNSHKYIVFAGVTFGYLALTKPIFGYVILTMMLCTIVLVIINKKNINYKKSIVILIVALATTAPWLGYTYHMTGKLFYWSSYGGNNFYWMSSPYENEYGDWMTYPFPSVPQKYSLPDSWEKVKMQHQKDFEQIFKSKEAQDLYIRNGKIHGSPYTGVIQDDILKKIAIQNIKSHPLKFIENCFSNVGRMLFNFPYSYKVQRPQTLLRLPFNSIMVVFILFSLIPTIISWHKIIYPLRFLLFFTFLYLGGSILGSAETRMFTIIVPILLFWIAYIIQRTIKIKVNFE